MPRARPRVGSEINSLNMKFLLPSLREATRASHNSLDAAFGALDLHSRLDYARFLRGHAIGMASLYPAFSRFVTTELEQPCPNYLDMLALDLADLGEQIGQLPSVSVPDNLSDPAVAYVVSGSRLGLAVIRRNGYWGREHGLLSRYMEDEQGLAIWKEVSAWLKACEVDEHRASLEGDAAVAAFEIFREAFHASAVAPAPN